MRQENLARQPKIVSLPRVLRHASYETTPPRRSRIADFVTQWLFPRRDSRLRHADDGRRRYQIFISNDINNLPNLTHLARRVK